MTDSTATLFIDKVLACKIFTEDEILERVRNNVDHKKRVLKKVYGADEESIMREVRDYLRDIMGMKS